MLRVDSLRKSFKTLTAVGGVSFSLESGETLGLLGPNGAGKSTTINMLTGALRPDDGRVLIGESDDATSPEARRRIGVAPQALALYQDMTGQENLRFFAKLYGLSGVRLRDRVDWALEFAGLTERRKSKVSEYSGGMQRRLNLAAALIHEPDILLLDEPTVGVDPQSRNHIFECIEQLRNQGVSILYTTHYMEEAQRLCDRVAIMDAGRLLEIDTVESLISRHGGVSVVEGELLKTPKDAASLPGVLKDNTLRIETDNPFEEMAKLASSGLTFNSLRLRRPDLETVFLTLTGRKLRDE